MPSPAKAFIVTLVSAMTFAFGAAPASAAPQDETFAIIPTASTAETNAQTLNTEVSAIDSAALDTLLLASEVTDIPHGFDVEATIAQAENELGTSRATGWSQPGECIMSAQRWILAGGGNWSGSGDPVSNYAGATRLPVTSAQPGDVIQYEHIAYPTSWVSGVHTVLVTEVHSDGTFTIIESNNPGGSGLVSKNESWVPAPPAGFQAVAWRF